MAHLIILEINKRNANNNNKNKDTEDEMAQNITSDKTECTMDADMYLWDGDMDKLSTEA